MEKEYSMKNQGFGLIGILVVIAVIALISGGSFYLREAKNQKSIEQVGIEKIKEAEALKQKIEQRDKQAQAQQVATSTIDTSNWKTYRNEQYGFEMRYPGDWNFIVTQSGVTKA